MRSSKAGKGSKSVGVQKSALPDVIRRLGEIQRRLARSRLWCDNDRQRHWIEQAEHEVYRGIQLLEAELGRTAYKHPPLR